MNILAKPRRPADIEAVLFGDLPDRKPHAGAADGENDFRRTQVGVTIGLPDMDGVVVLREIRAQSKTPIIIVSARGLERDKVAALDLGADDYIVKPFGTAELLARIRTALRHSPRSMSTEPQGQTSKTIGELTIDYQKHLVTLRSEVLHLTPNEYKLLALLSVNAGKVLTHDALIREVWGQYGNESHTLRVNMANLRRKIEENPGSPRYILTEMGVGYRMAEE